jgi:hypothetical protein
VVVVDGRVAGTWELSDKAVSVQPFASWPRSVDVAIRDEADRVAAFLDRPLEVAIVRPLG